jgi:hypothetical protein
MWSDPNDFPALGSLNPSQHLPTSSSTYAAQAQPSGGSSTSSQPHLPMYMQGMGTLAPPPPPGIGPATPQSTGTNGLLENLRGEDFPALGADKERVCRLRGRG